MMVLGAATLLLVQGTALADIQVGGNTTGSAFFSGASNLGSSFTTGGATLSFSSTTFGPQLSNSTLTLGSFSQGCAFFGCIETYTNDNYDFHLLVTFTTPQSSIPAPATISADVQGKLSGIFGINSNSVIINFGGPTHFTYSNTSGSGAFDLTVNDLSLASGNSLTGTISNAGFTSASTPEPASIVLLGSLMIGLGVFMRKRLSA